MSVITFRPDYAKFVMELPRGLFNQYYQTLNRLSHEVKFHGEWLKSHKVTTLYSQHPDMETTIVEIWGEWAGLVRSLPFREWARFLRRFDARAIVWDADKEAVLAVGQRLQRADCGYNVEVFNSKPASKRLGRDRGGVGFRVGSRKSDMCLVVYKRSGEPVATEYRVMGHILRTMVDATVYDWAGHEAIKDLWQHFIERVAHAGQLRLNRVLDRAGIGVYWPTYALEGREDYDQLQSSFAVHLTKLQEKELMDGAPADWQSDTPIPEE